LRARAATSTSLAGTAESSHRIPRCTGSRKGAMPGGSAPLLSVRIGFQPLLRPSVRGTGNGET
jgi:hypothetical protein